MNPNDDPLRVLVLCTGNSARSILAEFLLRAFGRGRFEVHSAGAKPTGQVNPLAVRVLREDYVIDASTARLKSWDEFRNTAFDIVITVCDHAREICPIGKGAPIVAHWSSPDPASVEGTLTERHHAFQRVAAQIAHRMRMLCALSPERVHDAAAVRAIGFIAPMDHEAKPASDGCPSPSLAS